MTFYDISEKLVPEAQRHYPFQLNIAQHNCGSAGLVSTKKPLGSGTSSKNDLRGCCSVLIQKYGNHTLVKNKKYELCCFYDILSSKKGNPDVKILHKL